MSYILDPIPYKPSKRCLDSILPTPTVIFISSPTSDISSQCFKSALVTSTIKKKCVVLNDLYNYRPVSNLLFICMILEKHVLSHVSSHLNSHNLYSTFQSYIVLVSSLKQLFLKMLMICSFLLTKATCLQLFCFTFLQHFTQLIILSLYTVSMLTLHLLMQSINCFHLI